MCMKKLQRHKNCNWTRTVKFYFRQALKNLLMIIKHFFRLNDDAKIIPLMLFLIKKINKILSLM